MWFSDEYHLQGKKNSQKLKTNKLKNSKSERGEVLKLYDTQRPSFWLEIPVLSPAPKISVIESVIFTAPG